ncbi:MAG: short-chain dehydrogenase/reductase [Gammaproteobacteria bacterium]|jgi:NAD(P)-dependent dehydrogenase (short-subunit alcohol dehydrogenase family)|nr:short-chain dehydrogenase/reductase [Gammaproteobacteria bacterium]
MHTILITGANRGIGLEMVKQYAGEGWQVLACCRKPNSATDLQALAKTQSQIKLYRLDVTSSEDIQRLTTELSDTPIDIILNNAGIWGPHEQHFNQLKPEAWLEVLTVNSIAPFMLTQALFNNVVNSQLKLVVMMSSIMGSIGENNEGSHYIYRSSKAALNMAVKSLAIDLKNQQVTVVALNPGWVKTDMGGENALLSPQESVQNLRQTLSKLQISDTGKFLNYTGVEIAW